MTILKRKVELVFAIVVFLAALEALATVTMRAYPTQSALQAVAVVYLLLTLTVGGSALIARWIIKKHDN